MTYQFFWTNKNHAKRFRIVDDPEFSVTDRLIRSLRIESIPECMLRKLIVNKTIPKNRGKEDIIIYSTFLHFSNALKQSK